MSQFTEEQLKEVKRNLEGQVIINKEIIAAQVEAGWKKDVLAKHYELPVASITSILKTLGLKIRKFHKPTFVIDGVDSPSVTEAVETESPTEENIQPATVKEEKSPKIEKVSKEMKTSKTDKVKEEKQEEVAPNSEDDFKESNNDEDFQTEEAKSDEQVQEEVAQEDNAGDWGDDSSEEEEWV